MSVGNGGLAANGAPSAAISGLRDGLAAAAASGQRCLPRGHGTKDALSTATGSVAALDLSGLSGIVEYEPSEFTITALAGTPIADLRAELDANRQYLPFDPILVDAGATVGGTIAAGVSGSGRVRYGGIRDFVLGVRFLDGDGTLVRGGGKVVKNAAGFDLPKLMVGSLGALGVLIEVTLKVFPAAEATATARVDLGDLDAAVAAMRRLLAGPTEVDALDLEPPGRLWTRIAGRAKALSARLDRALGIAAGEGTSVEDEEAARHWQAMRELSWVPSGWSLVKVPLQPGRIAAFEEALGGRLEGTAGPRAVYTAGGQQALVTWPAGRPLDDLERGLERLALSGLVVRGPSGRRRLGRRAAEAAIDRARQALDPHGRFREP